MPTAATGAERPHDPATYPSSELTQDLSRRIEALFFEMEGVLRSLGPATPQDPRAELCAWSCDLAMSHAFAIGVLLNHRHFGSADTLLRPAFEAWVRANWFWRCLQNKDRFDEFERSRRHTPKLDRMIGQLAKDSKTRSLTRVYAKAKDVFDSLTHGDMAQLERRRDEATHAIGQVFSEDHVRATAKFAGLIMVRSFALWVGPVVGRHDLAARMIGHALSVFDIDTGEAFDLAALLVDDAEDQPQPNAPADH